MKANLPAETKMLTETWATKDYNKNLVNFITESKTIKLGKKNAWNLSVYLHMLEIHVNTLCK